MQCSDCWGRQWDVGPNVRMISLQAESDIDSESPKTPHIVTNQTPFLPLLNASFALFLIRLSAAQDPVREYE